MTQVNRVAAGLCPPAAGRRRPRSLSPSVSRAVTGRLRSRTSPTSGVGPISGTEGPAGLANGHLADSLQCLAWLEGEVSGLEGIQGTMPNRPRTSSLPTPPTPVRAQPPASAARARSGTPATTSALAAGTAAGVVRAYDSATGGLIWQADDCIEG